MIELRGYIDENGKKRFAEWLDQLDPRQRHCHLCTRESQ